MVKNTNPTVMKKNKEDAQKMLEAVIEFLIEMIN